MIKESGRTKKSRDKQELLIMVSKVIKGKKLSNRQEPTQVKKEKKRKQMTLFAPVEQSNYSGHLLERLL